MQGCELRKKIVRGSRSCYYPSNSGKRIELLWGKIYSAMFNKYSRWKESLYFFCLDNRKRKTTAKTCYCVSGLRSNLCTRFNFLIYRLLFRRVIDQEHCRIYDDARKK